MANVLLAGTVLTGAGVAVVGATVEVFDRDTVTPVRATFAGGTDASGDWNFSYAPGANSRRVDVRVTNGSSISFLKYDDQLQVSSVETANLRIINPAFTFEYDIVPAAITAARQLNLPLITGTATLAAIDEGVKGADIASAATLTLVAGSDFADVTGTTTVTAISTRPAGSRFTFQFDGALILTHNATTLILQGAANQTTAAGDVISFISEGAGNWRELSRRLAAAAGGGVTSGTADVTTTETTTSTTYTDLPTVGPAVTLSPGATQNHLIEVNAHLGHNAAGGEAWASVAIAGAAAVDVDAAKRRNDSTSQQETHHRVTRAASVVSGSTHTMKYRASAATASFLNRRIIVLSGV